jgi:signal transduction histidine kinase
MLLRLINDIIRASSISESEEAYNPTTVDFAKAFDDICQDMKKLVNEPIAFIKENPFDSFFTSLDQGRIRQVITNFVSNSVKHTREGYIKVGYSYQSRGLYIYCEDTGAGIPKDQQEAVFERFVKLDEFTQGTGLGLNICQAIARQCKGKIGVISEGEGHGSTFWFWIPCKKMNK